MKITYKQNETLPDVQYIKTTKSMPTAGPMTDTVGNLPEYDTKRLDSKGITVEKEGSIKVSRISMAMYMIVGMTLKDILRSKNIEYAFSIELESI